MALWPRQASLATVILQYRSLMSNLGEFAGRTTSALLREGHGGENPGVTPQKCRIDVLKHAIAVFLGPEGHCLLDELFHHPYGWTCSWLVIQTYETDGPT